MNPAVYDAPSRTDLRKQIAKAVDARRRSLRVDVDGALITLAPAAIRPDVALMEITMAGFRIATSQPVPVGRLFMSDLMMEDGARMYRWARVAYCKPQPPDGHDGGFVSRLDFLEGPDVDC